MAAAEPLEPAVRRRAARFRLAAILIALGLVVEAATLSPVQPWAFLVFVLVGCSLVALGIGLYFYAVITR